MATSDLTTTTLVFSNGVNVNAQLTSSLDTFTLFSTSGANNAVAIENISNLQLQGSVSGTFTQSPSATTTSYGVTWPDAQAAVSGYVLSNDSTGVLTWEPQTAGSVGAVGDIQLSDGSGGFQNATASSFNFADGINSILTVGVNAGEFRIQGTNGTTLEGTDIIIAAGEGGSGVVDGGLLRFLAGDQLTGNGDGGSIEFLSGSSTTTGDGGVIELTAGTSSSGGIGGSLLMEGGIGNDGGDLFISGGQGVSTDRASILLEGGKTANGGNIQFVAGDSVGLEDGGILTFVAGATVGGTSGFYEFTESGNISSQVLTIQGSIENSTSTSTGTLRVPGGGGIGVTGDIYSNDYTATGTMNIQGSVSGTFTQSASATTTSYGVTWPDAQAALAGQVLTNDSSGVLTWETPTPIENSAGALGDIQLSDGSGGFNAATTTSFNFTDGVIGVLSVGGENTSFQIQGENGVTLAGSDVEVIAGDGGNGVVNGGTIQLLSGAQAIGTGNGGDILLEASQGSVDGGSITLTSGVGNGGSGGIIRLQPGTGTVSNGVIELRAPDVTTDEFIEIQTSAGANLITMLSVAQNATSTSTGTLRVLSGGGIGVSGDIFSNDYTATGTVNIQGSVSGTFTQSASATTTSYGVTWPDAQAALAGQVLTNDSTGVLTWETPTPIENSAGALGDIQLSDGSGGFQTGTPSVFNFTASAGVSQTLTVGEEATDCTIQLTNATTADTAGAGLLIIAGASTGIGQGGSITVRSGTTVDVNSNSGDVSLQTMSSIGTGTAGTVQITAGAMTGVGGTGGDIVFELTPGATNPGGIIFDGPDTASTTNYVYFRDSASTNIVTIPSGVENSTSTSTGSIRVPGGGGIGVTGDIFSNDYTATGTINLQGSVSGTFTQSASATTTSYGVTWPDAQAALAGQVLTNDSAGVLTWETPSGGSSAGVSGDIQLSDGLGGFQTGTPSTFNFDGTSHIWTVGEIASETVLLLVSGVAGNDSGGSFRIVGGDASGSGSPGQVAIDAGNGGTTGGGSNVTLLAGSGGSVSGAGGLVSITGGNGTASGTNGGQARLIGGMSGGGSGNSGAVTLQTIGGVGTGTAGNIQLTAGAMSGVGGTGGSIRLQLSTGATTPGTIIHQGPAAASSTDAFIFRDSGSTNVVTIPSGIQNATSTSTGSIRVPGGGGIGVTGDIFSNDYTATGTINIQGSVSGTFTQSASATTTSYGVTWPDAQAALAGQVLTNDSSGVLTWETPTPIENSAGALGDIQLSDGSGGFQTGSPAAFNFTASAGVSQTFTIGEEATTCTVQMANATTVDTLGGALLILGGAGDGVESGGAVEIIGGEGGDTGNGNSATLRGGPGGATSGDGGVVAVAGGQATVGNGGPVAIRGGSTDDISANTGSITIFTTSTTGGTGSAGTVRLLAGAPDGVGGTGGNIELELETGATNPGVMSFQGPSAASSTDTFIFRDSAATSVVTIPSGVENATSTSTGSIRVPGGGGIGCTGDIYCNTVNAVSDINMKANVKNLVDKDCLQWIQSITPYEYNFRNGRQLKSFGVIAQEISKIPRLKEAIVRGEENQRAIDYNGLIAILIGAIKELSNQIQTQTQTN